MSFLWKIGIGAILSAALAGAAMFAIHSYNDALVTAQKAQEDLKTEQANKKVVEDQLAAQAKEAADAKAREDQANALVQEKVHEAEIARAVAQQFSDKLTALKRQKPVVAAWADTPVPPDIDQLLRDYHAGNKGSGGDKASPGGSAVVDDHADTGAHLVLPDKQ